jgi:hypothetical protein
LNKENLVAFLYMLMRDSLPTGEVARLVVEVEKTKGQEIAFTSKGLEAYARELSDRLLSDK